MKATDRFGGEMVRKMVMCYMNYASSYQALKNIKTLQWFL